MVEDVARNPGLLKLDLYCRGIRLDDSCRLAEDGGREIMRTRAGLGSGLEVILPEGLYTNIPVVEEFAKDSPYELRRGSDGYRIFRDGGPVARVKPAPRPGWYGQRTASGKKMSAVGSLQGTYLAIYPARVCDYWLEQPEKSNCKFCSVGLNLGCDDADEKTVADVLETVGAAVRENRITYLDFNTGHYEGDTYLDILEPFIRAVKREYGLLIGVQTPPHHDLARYRELKRMGVNRVSFCFEIWDPTRFRQVCPGKDRQYGLERYLEAIEYCARIFHTTNGEIVAGLEPPENSIEAIDWITSVGAVPTVCVFRPLKGTDYENLPPPRTDELVPVFRRMYEACMERGLMIGVAPNVKVSLVLLPEEGRYFVDNPNKYFMTRARHALLRPVFAAALRTRLV
ncbi:MAG: radical SAM protein [Candidatus Glassbacteria bacterium]|nr:radical SAM protein [Candidatus Glassbacteria bacterium]